MSSLNRAAASRNENRRVKEAAQSIEVLEPNARFKEACRYQFTTRQKVIYLDSPMRPMVFMPTHPGPWAVHTTTSCFDQLRSYVFDVEQEITLYEAIQTDPRRQTAAVWPDGRRQIHTLREFLGRCNRDVVAFTSTGLDYDSLPADWDCVWNDQVMTWVACERGKPIGEMSLAAHTLHEAVPEATATKVIDLIAVLRRSIADDDKAKGEAATTEKAKAAKPRHQKHTTVYPRA